MDRKQLQDRLKESIPHLKAEIDFAKINKTSSNEIIDEAQPLFNQWSNFEPEERRRIVDSITDNRLLAYRGVLFSLLLSVWLFFSSE